MVLNLTKKQLKRMYGLTDWTFRTWINDVEHIILSKSKSTLNPKQIVSIINEFGFPPFTSESERLYIEKVIQANTPK